MHHLDGNVLAGATSDLFSFELTTSQAQCQSCSDIATLGQAMVYGQPMGFVARCRNCESVLMVIVQRGREVSLNMGGLRWLRVVDRATTDGIHTRV